MYSEKNYYILKNALNTIVKAIDIYKNDNEITKDQLIETIENQIRFLKNL